MNIAPQKPAAETELFDCLQDQGDDQTDIVSDAPRMDERGNWFDADGSRIPNVDVDPRIQKTAAPVAMAPILVPGMTGATLAALVAAGVITATQSKEFQKQLDDWAAPESPDIDPKKRKQDRHSQPRISTPPDVPTQETFPADELPDTPTSQANAEDDMTTTFPDQSDDPDINGPQVVEMDNYERKLDLSKNEYPDEKFMEPVDGLAENPRQILHNHVLSDGLLTGHNKNSVYHIEKTRSADDLKSDFDQLVEEYGRGVGGGRSTVEIDRKGYPVELFFAHDGSVILHRDNSESGPTLEIKVPHKNGRQGRVTYKVRYGRKE